MPRRARASFAVAALLAALASTPARADEPTLWDEMTRPEGARYGDLVSRAVALLQAGSAPAAARVLEDAVALDGREPLGLYLLGLARFKSLSWPGCADVLGRLVRVAPGYRPPAAVLESGFDAETVDDMLGLCLGLGGRLDEAVAHYRRLLAGGGSIGPETLHGNLGDCYHALGRLEEAIAEYQAALAIAPRRASLHAALAVAYDRDERFARAREAMAHALEIDPPLAELQSGNIYFIPPADQHYYLGLGHLVAGDAAPHRALAIAYFRKYLDLSGPKGPWAARARLHLGELGPTVLRVADVVVTPADAPEGPAVSRALAAEGPELASCFEAGGRVVVRVSLAFHEARPGGEPAAAPTVSLTSIGPDPVPTQVFECIDRILTARRHVVAKTTRFQIAIAPP